MPNYQPYIQWLTQQYSEMYPLLMNWSAINSGTHHIAGVERQLTAYRNAFKKLEAEDELISLPAHHRLLNNGQVIEQAVAPALRVWKRPQAPLQVLLCGHSDTVYGQHHSFQKPQLLDFNTLNGPGVADMKGGILVMLYALLALERSPFREQLGWQILLTPDEEIGSLSSAPLLDKIAKQVQLALVYEPAMTAKGTLAAARKGSGKFDIVVHGVAAHAGRDFSLGKNAITKMARIIMEIDALNKNDREFTINVGNIQGGEAVNIVPDLCIAHLDIRYQQQQDATFIQQQLEHIVQQHAAESGYGVNLYGGITRPAKPFEGNTARLFRLVQQAGRELGLSINWQSSGGCCDGNNLAANGLPVVDSLGVRGGNLHNENEYVLLDSLIERSQLSGLLLMKLATGESQL